jgi:hypothetical protein
MHVRTNTMGSTYYVNPLDEDTTEIVTEGKKIVVHQPWDKINQGWYDWMMGMHIQNAFPFLTPSEREFLLTGLTDKEWKELFGEGEVEI